MVENQLAKIMDISIFLPGIPEGLCKPLIQEYRTITQKYLEGKWRDSSLSGGHFCEIVYSILHGYGTGSYPNTPSKPRNFVGACKQLENFSNAPRSMQILIPRLLPPLYEIRNNRNIGHTGGDVDPNRMDANAVVSISSWILSELVRVYHNSSLTEAQSIVDSISSRKISILWDSGEMKRILDPSLTYSDQILLLLSSESEKVSIEELLSWLDNKDKTYIKKVLKKLHDKRLANVTNNEYVEILPPGSLQVEKIIKVYAKE